MRSRKPDGATVEPQFFTLESGDVEALEALTSRRLGIEELAFAAEVDRGVALYDVASLADDLGTPDRRRALLSEWAWVLGQSSGVLVLRGAVPDGQLVDDVTAVFNAIIDGERAGGSGDKADHFAAAGANDRIWNAHQKLCEADTTLFARYAGTPAIAAVCEAWLGPGYQVTSQVNLVRPGGAAQQAHRDYHLGFQTAETAARFPAHAHDLSAVMTLQGAVAHCDMPVISGTTQLLPFSQLFRPGYMAYRRAAFREFFADHAIQLPLSKGDALFFNPALFHAAGDNRSENIARMANLLQVSSAFGRAMETLDRDAMCRRLYPVLAGLCQSGALSPAERDAAIAATAEGYSFPTNLDTDPPRGGLAPETQAALFHRALEEGWDVARFSAGLDAMTDRRRA